MTRDNIFSNAGVYFDGLYMWDAHQSYFTLEWIGFRGRVYDKKLRKYANEIVKIAQFSQKDMQR